MGHHDPLDGYITCLALEATRAELGVRGPDLGGAIAEFRAMIEPGTLGSPASPSVAARAGSDAPPKAKF